MKKIAIYYNEDLSFWIDYNPRALNIIKSFKKEGYDVTLITRISKISQRTNAFLHKNKVIKIPNGAGFIQSIKIIKNLLKNENYEFVYTINLYAGVIMSFATRLHRINWFYDTMELFPEFEKNPIKKKIVSIFEQWVFNSAKKIIVVSEERRQHIAQKYNFEKNGVSSITVNNYLNRSKHKDNKSKQKEFLKKNLIYKDKILFVYIGGIKPGRGLENLLRAFSTINNKMAHLIIFGRDSDELLSNFLTSDITNITFAGFYNREELEPIRPIFDVGIISLMNVNLNNYYSANFKFSEYLNEGYIILAPDFPIYKRLITKKMGRLCSFEDVESIKDAINKITQMNIKRAKAYNEKIAGNYTWDAEFGKLLRFVQGYSRA